MRFRFRIASRKAAIGRSPSTRWPRRLFCSRSRWRSRARAADDSDDSIRADD